MGTEAPTFAHVAARGMGGRNGQELDTRSAHGRTGRGVVVGQVIRHRIRGARSAEWPVKEVPRLSALFPLFVKHRFSVLGQSAPVLDLAESVLKLNA